MDLIKKKEPFPHILVEDHYTKDELFHMWREIEFLSYTHKLESPEQTSSATGEFGPLKNNYGIFLDYLYKNRDISSILKITRKIFDSKFSDEVSSFDLIFKAYANCWHDSTLLSYYENSQEYKEHYDICYYTALSWIYREPKKFAGGDLYFPEYGYTCKVKHNRFIIFPSSIHHQVLPVTLDYHHEDEFGSLSTMGRYCISQFITHTIN